MANRVKLNLKGFRQLRTEPAVRKFVQQQAEKVADAAGSGCEALETEAPRNRARSAVVGPKGKSEDMLRALGSRMQG